MSGFPYRRYPCAECPFRRDVKPGQFPACRYEALRETAGKPGAEAGFSAPVFACHKTREGREEACAGWLAVAGYGHLGIRLAVAMRRLPGSALEPGEGWPDLFGSYDEMAAVQAAGQEQPMDQFKAGDVIEHRLMPGFTMTVLDTKDCETDANRPEPHLAYQVTDPEGNPDWLCAHDVQKPGEGLSWR